MSLFASTDKGIKPVGMGTDLHKIGSVRYQHPYIISLVSAKPGKILPSVKKIFFGGGILLYVH